MSVNKFSIDWQICRVRARSIKDVDNKIKFVISFLETYRSKENVERVLNWLKMTRVGYKDEAIRKKFDRVIDDVKVTGLDYFEKDNVNDLSCVSDEDIEMVLKDLNKRKYGFQFNKVPKDHVKFVSALEAELEIRNDSKCW